MTEEFEVGPHQVVIEDAEGWGTIYATFTEPGEYLLVCNEYCGTAHHLMQGTLIVESR